MAAEEASGGNADLWAILAVVSLNIVRSGEISCMSTARCRITAQLTTRCCGLAPALDGPSMSARLAECCQPAMGGDGLAPMFGDKWPCTVAMVVAVYAVMLVSRDPQSRAMWALCPFAAGSWQARTHHRQYVAEIRQQRDAATAPHRLKDRGPTTGGSEVGSGRDPASRDIRLDQDRTCLRR